MSKQESSSPDLLSVLSHLLKLLNNVRTPPCGLGSDLNHVESSASQRISMLKRDAEYIQASLSNLNGFHHRFDDLVKQLENKIDEDSALPDRVLRFLDEPLFGELTDAVTQLKRQLLMLACDDDEELKFRKKPMDLPAQTGDSASAGVLLQVNCGEIREESDLPLPNGHSKSAGEILQVDCGEIQVEMDLTPPDGGSKSTGEIPQVNLIAQEETPECDILDANYNELHDTRKECLWCFSVFPESAAIKKRVLIYWWIGEKFIGEEKLADEIFRELELKRFIEPVVKQGRITNSCKLKPSARSFVISKAKAGNFIVFDENDELSDQTCRATLMRSEQGFSLQELVQHKPGVVKELRTLFNVDEMIIGVESDTFADVKSLQVLHIGRSHSNDLIVLKDTKFMKRLIKMKQLRLLSLQGIASIRELPKPVILWRPLKRLMILDLRACNALESLPRWIRSLGCLTHLDVSACHSLICMPKGLSELSQLQVLKGFVVRKLSRGDRKTSCTLHDLLKLKKLERLSICILGKDFPKSNGINDIANMMELIKLKMVWRAPPVQEQEERDVHVDDQETGDLIYQEEVDEEEEEIRVEMMLGAQHELGLEGDGRSELSAVSRLEQGKEQEGGGDITDMSTICGTDQGEEDEGPSEHSARGLLSHETTYPVENGQVERDPVEQTYVSRELRNTDEVVQLRKLEKLDLWCLPQEAALELLDPIKFPSLKKLYIRGSRIQNLHHNHSPDQQGKWNVETLRLLYLRNLKIAEEELNGLFPELSYLGKVECPGVDFPCNGEGFWQRDGI